MKRTRSLRAESAYWKRTESGIYEPRPWHEKEGRAEEFEDMPNVQTILER